MSLAGGEGMLAAGNINPCRFVKRVLTAGQANDGTVQEASALADKVVGVSQEGTRRAPIASYTNDGYAAISGENIKVFQPGDICLLELTAAAVTRGDRLTVDSVGATGKGRTAVAGEISFAIALDTAAASEKVRVRVTFPDTIGAS